ncbi:MAG: hypothetical protein ACOCVH_01215 [Verrucomicrobiota bacterium]
MPTFKIHAKATAPDASKKAFERAQEKFGMLPKAMGLSYDLTGPLNWASPPTFSVLLNLVVKRRGDM